MTTATPPTAEALLEELAALPPATALQRIDAALGQLDRRLGQLDKTLAAPPRGDFVARAAAKEERGFYAGERAMLAEARDDFARALDEERQRDVARHRAVSEARHLAAALAAGAAEPPPEVEPAAYPAWFYDVTRSDAHRLVLLLRWRLRLDREKLAALGEEPPAPITITL